MPDQDFDTIHDCYERAQTEFKAANDALVAWYEDHRHDDSIWGDPEPIQVERKGRPGARFAIQFTAEETERIFAAAERCGMRTMAYLKQAVLNDLGQCEVVVTIHVDSAERLADAVVRSLGRGTRVLTGGW